MKASELIGSRVLALDTAKICGIICDIIPSPDYKKIPAVEVLMEDENDCEKKYLELKKCMGFREGTITVKRASDLVMCYSAPASSPINLPAYGENGENYDRVSDVVTDDKRNVIALNVSEKSFPPADILSYSEELIVFRLPGSKTRISKQKKKIPSVCEKVKFSENQVSSVVRITEIGRYAFLKGKRLGEDVTDLSGLPFAIRGETITDETIRLAKEKGAIVKLTMASR